LSGYIFATKTCIDNRKNLIKQQYLIQKYPQYGEILLRTGKEKRKKKEDRNHKGKI